MGKIEMRNIMSLLIFHHHGYNNRNGENENEVGICTTNKRIFFVLLLLLLRRSISPSLLSVWNSYSFDYPGNASALSHFILCQKSF